MSKRLNSTAIISTNVPQKRSSQQLKKSTNQHKLVDIENMILDEDSLPPLPINSTFASNIKETIRAPFKTIHFKTTVSGNGD